MEQSSLQERLCVYCGEQPATTLDHVPPKCMFPAPKPSNLLTVPSCASCNEGAAKDEEWFRAAILWSPAGESEAGKALWKQTLARGYRKNRGLRQSMAKALRPVDICTPAGVFLKRGIAIDVDPVRTHRVISKITRGLYCIEHGRPLPPSVGIIVRLLSNKPNLLSAVDKCNPMLVFGSRRWPDVFEYRHGWVPEKPEASMWLLRFYGKLVYWAISEVTPSGTIRESKT